MSPRGLSVLALAGLLGTSGFVFALWPRSAPAAQEPGASARSVSPSPSPAPSAAPPPSDARFALLPAVLIRNQTTRQERTLKLYGLDGQIDEAAAHELDELLCDARKPKQHESTRLDRRTLQLVFKA